MSNRAETVLTDAVNAFFKPTITDEGTELIVRSILQALETNRIALVELPGAEVWDGPGKERYWRIGDTTVTVDKWNVLSVTLNDDWSDDEAPPSAADFRDLAAALLAAAAEVTE
ncbi:DNA methyltransferase [Mycobacterium phage Ibhubesi]|uniref:Uncharacterized protein n=1 Tax=Mycobacterium phage Ibhubesi TaxID=2922205 RepID=G1D309_9CAUD|nr:DNA methyltransferase [Mycobacterium phage Ibhubesi]AEK09159.1 hypothetical protein PBI_IBHUBESI_63 [Mycobacterium phage Ibhubesi]